MFIGERMTFTLLESVTSAQFPDCLHIRTFFLPNSGKTYRIFNRRVGLDLEQFSGVKKMLSVTDCGFLLNILAVEFRPRF